MFSVSDSEDIILLWFLDHIKLRWPLPGSFLEVPMPSANYSLKNLKTRNLILEDVSTWYLLEVWWTLPWVIFGMASGQPIFAVKSQQIPNWLLGYQWLLISFSIPHFRSLYSCLWTIIWRISEVSMQRRILRKSFGPDYLTIGKSGHQLFLPTLLWYHPKWESSLLMFSDSFGPSIFHISKIIN